MYDKLKIHGFFINDSNHTQALTEVEEMVKSGEKGYVCFCEGNLLTYAVKDEKIKKILNEAALVYPDGMVMQLMAKFYCNKKIARITGPDFLLTSCEYGQKKKWRHFFYGGAEGVADVLKDKLSEKYPDLIVAGTYCPPFRDLDDKEEIQVKEMIESSKADLLWVGLGGPKQEIWMNKHLNKIDVPVMLGVGAAFDFHSGNRAWAPSVVRLLKLEWIYRLFVGNKTFFKRWIRAVPIILCLLLSGIVNFIKGNFQK